MGDRTGLRDRQRGRQTAPGPGKRCRARPEGGVLPHCVCVCVQVQKCVHTHVCKWVCVAQSTWRGVVGGTSLCGVTLQLSAPHRLDLCWKGCPCAHGGGAEKGTAPESGDLVPSRGIPTPAGSFRASLTEQSLVGGVYLSLPVCCWLRPQSSSNSRRRPPPPAACAGHGLHACPGWGQPRISGALVSRRGGAQYRRSKDSGARSQIPPMGAPRCTLLLGSHQAQVGPLELQPGYPLPRCL